MACIRHCQYLAKRIEIPEWKHKKYNLLCDCSLKGNWNEAEFSRSALCCLFLPSMFFQTKQQQTMNSQIIVCNQWSTKRTSHRASKITKQAECTLNDNVIWNGTGLEQGLQRIVWRAGLFVNCSKWSLWNHPNEIEDKKPVNSSKSRC